MPTLSLATRATTIDQLQYEERAIVDAAQDLGFETVYLVNPSLMAYGLVHGMDTVVMSYCGRLFHTHALVVRATSGAEAATAMLVRAVRANGGTLLDPVSRHTTGKASKLTTTFSRWQNGSGITTFFAFSQTGLSDVLRMVDSYASWPIIAKPHDGSHGVGVAEFTTPAQVVQSIGRSVGSDGVIMLQPKIDIVNEWRVVLMDGVTIGMARKTAAEGEIAANVARGGTLSKDHREDVIGFVESKVSDAGLFGVDVIEDRDGQLYIMEANRAPGAWEAFKAATGIDVARESIWVMKQRMIGVL